MSAVATPTVQAVLNRLDNVQPTRDGFSARCPCHDDGRNSLCISTGDDGRVLLFCQTEICETPAIVEAVGLKMADLFPPKARTNGKSRACPR